VQRRERDATTDQCTQGDIGTHYAGLVYNHIAEIVAPDSAPNITVCPRGGC
jgi:hypothetical protein